MNFLLTSELDMSQIFVARSEVRSVFKIQLSSILRTCFGGLIRSHSDFEKSITAYFQQTIFVILLKVFMERKKKEYNEPHQVRYLTNVQK